MKAHFEMMAGYNAWANARACAAAALLSPEALREPLGAAFGSVIGTLNHIMVADLVWLARFRGIAGPRFALDHVLHDDIGDFSAARRVLDADIGRFVAGLSDDDLASEISYMRATAPEPVRQALWPALAHFFNHQTHHRGQVHALLTRLTGSAPALDLVYYQREAA